MKTLADFDMKSRRLGGIKGYSKSQYKEALTFVDKYVESLHRKNRKF